MFTLQRRKPAYGDPYGTALISVSLHRNTLGFVSERTTADFVVEIFGSLKYYLDALRGKPETRATQGHPGLRMYRSRTGGGMATSGGQMDFATAFGVYTPRAETDRKLGVEGAEPVVGYEEGIRLAPYKYQESPSSPEPDDSAGA